MNLRACMSEMNLRYCRLLSWPNHSNPYMNHTTPAVRAIEAKPTERVRAKRVRVKRSERDKAHLKAVRHERDRIFETLMADYDLHALRHEAALCVVHNASANKSGSCASFLATIWPKFFDHSSACACLHFVFSCVRCLHCLNAKASINLVMLDTLDACFVSILLLCASFFCVDASL